MATATTAGALNPGRLVQFITGIQGVSAGGQASVNIPTNSRYHRLIMQCKGGTPYTSALTPVMAAAAGGTPATFTAAYDASGRVVSVTLASAGSGQTPGTYDCTFTGGGTGSGAIVTATVNAAGLVTQGGITILAQGGGGFVDPSRFFTSIKHQVNGITIRDIDPQDVLGICIANGYLPLPGECPFFFTEPWRDHIVNNESTSWDLFGQNTYQITFGISAAIPSPVLTGVQEYDNFQNTIPDPNGGGGRVAFLAIVTQHAFSFPVGVGQTTFTQIPFNFPTLRFWIRGSVPGSITQVEIYQDKNLVFQATTEQLKQLLAEYNFAFNSNPLTGLAGINTTVPNGTVLTPYDAAVVFDMDDRPWKGLTCLKSLDVRVYSSVAQNVTIVQEQKAPAYA